MMTDHPFLTKKMVAAKYSASGKIGHYLTASPEVLGSFFGIEV